MKIIFVGLLLIINSTMKIDDYKSIYDLLDIYEKRYKEGVFCSKFVFEFNAQFADSNLNFIENLTFFKYFLVKQEYEYILNRLNVEIYARQYLILRLNLPENRLINGLSEFTIIKSEIKSLNLIEKNYLGQIKNLEKLNYNTQKLNDYINFIPKLKLFHLFYLSCIEIRQKIFKNFINYKRIFKDKDNMHKDKILNILKGRQNDPIYKFVVLLLDIIEIEEYFHCRQIQKWKRLKYKYFKN